MGDWRPDLASDAQKKFLIELGIPFPEDITKGEASDLIGTKFEPEEECVEVLKFFKVPGISEMSQTDARKAEEAIFLDPVKTERWENRPADREQKAIYRFFKMPVPRGLRHRDAAATISELFEDDAKVDAWGRQESREDDLESALEMLNFSCEYYDCKKVGKRLFREIVEAMEERSLTLEEIESDEERFFAIALGADPSLRRKNSRREPASKANGQEKTSDPLSEAGGCLWVLVIALLVFWWLVDSTFG